MIASMEEARKEVQQIRKLMATYAEENWNLYREHDNPEECAKYYGQHRAYLDAGNRLELLGLQMGEKPETGGDTGIPMSAAMEDHLRQEREARLKLINEKLLRGYPKKED